VSSFWKALIGMSLFIVAAIWSGLTGPDDVAAQIKPYVGNWHSLSSARNRASFAIAWDAGKLHVTRYIDESDLSGRVDLTNTIKMDKARLGGGYTISGGQTSSGFEIRNLLPKDDTLQGEVVVRGARHLTTYVKDE
jgi:hypothetical protein